MTGKGITRYGWRLLSNREKGGCAMVTYDTLIQFGLLIVAIIGLVYKIAKK